MKILLAVVCAGMLALPALAWNPVTDVEQQTEWTLGQNAAAGTSVDLRNGQFDGSEFAGIASYRFLSVWYGGINVPQSDKTIKLTDALKLGLNLNYFMTGFVNRPPEFLQRLVVGPAIACPLITTPRVVNFFVDLNYVFGNIRTVPMPPAPTLAPPAVPAASKLNISYAPVAG